MASDEQLIADITASLRQTLSYLEADAGLQDQDHTIGTIRTVVLDTNETRIFDGDEANRALRAASARLATIQPRRPGLLLPITVAQAERFSSGMADLLCWARGFMAARPDDSDSHPMGVNRTRDLRLALIDAIAVARGEPEPGELPF